MAQADNPFGNTDWVALQRRYLDTLTSMGFPGGTPAAHAANPWQSALDYWWQGAAVALPAEHRKLLNEVVRQSRAFLSCGEFFAPLAEVLARQDRGGTGWEKELQRQFDLLKGQLDAGRMAPGMESLLGAWKLPPDFWEQTSAVLARMPDAWLGLMPEARVLAGQRADFTESLREGARLWQVYQQALSDYLQLLTRAAHQGLDCMCDRLLAGQDVRSLRELYDLWVDCGEAAFGDMMAGPDFAGHFAALVNALSAFRLHSRGIMDAGLTALAMPTAQALGSVQQREAGLRNELRVAQAHQREDREKLEQLQRELETLRRGTDT